MRLPEGFVVGGRYRIERLVAAGSKFRVYSAVSTDDDGPGQVAIKVARHDDVESLAGLEFGRSRVQAEWDALMRFHERATSAAPLPIELVYMYPGDPDVRRVALLDKKAVRREPYLVSEFADGTPLSALLQGERMDEERAMLIALRVVLLVRAARQVGVDIEDFSPSNFVVDHAGENLSVVGLTTGVPLPPARADIGRDAVPDGYGRLLAGLLGGVSAPDWGAEKEDRPRWMRLLESRRVPPEFHSLILGTLGFEDEFPPSLDAVENRVRALVRAPRPKVYDHPGRSHDAPYLIANGERIADRFDVIKPLGQGGRGFVYRARDSVSGAEVLFKCNKYVYDSGSAFALELQTRRLELEHEFDVLKTFAARTGMLPQPVALVRGRGRGSWFDLAPALAPGEPFVVMEWVKGIPLLDLLPHPFLGYEGARDASNRLPPRFVLRLVAQIAELIGRFHEAGYLYQDLKPENVLYDAKAENVYMVDFAGACPRTATGDLDKSHVAFGVQTHGFAAPEFAHLWERSDHRFDIYSLGATAYHLLTGVNPERVAIEEGTEYPTLSRGPLQTLPPPVATLVDKMLAPVDQRLPTAEAVVRLAEAARLQLSRSRPLDVRNPSVAYTAEGVALRWDLPQDPRIDAMRVRRFGESESESEVVYTGPLEDEFVDTAPSGDDRSYVVETAYTRGGRIKHSRGRVLHTEANPAPVLFRVEPYFGGNRVRCEVAPHSSELVVRWSAEAPPMAVDDGEALDMEPGQTVLHLVDEGVTVHYAAFALYDDVVSAPRFGSATALGALPDPGAMSVEQVADGVRVRWETADPAFVVLAEPDAGAPRRLVPAAGATEVLDDAVLPDARVIYRLLAVESGVTSEQLAKTAVHRWPALPPLSLTPGPERVTLDAGSAPHPRFTGFEVGTARDGESVEEWHRIDGLPAATPLPAEEPVVVALRGIVDGADGGPGVAGVVVAPPVDAPLQIDARDGLLPLELDIALPESAVSWMGQYTLIARVDGEQLDERVAEVVSWMRDDRPPGVTVVDPTLAPAEEAVYTVSLVAPDGGEVARGRVAVRGREQLPEPQCQARLAGVIIAAIDGVERVDLRVERSAGPPVELADVRLPLEVDLEEGEDVRVCVRRAVSGAPMPWSEPAELSALARPPVPVGVRASLQADGPVIEWTPIVANGIAYVVRDASDGTLLYTGADARFVDVSGRGARRYAVAAVRHGLESPSVEVALTGGAPRVAGGGALVPIAARRSRGLLPAADTLVQCVSLGRTNLVEVAGPAQRRLVVVLRGTDESRLDALTARLHEPEWMRTPGLEAVQIVTGRRAVVPWRGKAGPVRVLTAALELERPEWRLLTSRVEPTRGTLVGAVSEQARRVWLWTRRATLPVADGDAVLVYKQDGGVARAKIQTPKAQPISALGPRGVEVWLAANVQAAAGLGLELAGNPAVLIPCGSDTEDGLLSAMVWSDASRGFPLFVAQRLEATWRAPVASLSLGSVSVFHFLKSGRHVELALGCEVVSRWGRVRLHVEVSSDAGRFNRSFGVSLARPRTFPGLVARVARWVDRKLDVEDGPADPIALIA